MKPRILILLMALSLAALSACAAASSQPDSQGSASSAADSPPAASSASSGSSDATQPDEAVVRELFQQAANTLILYATEEPSRVLSSDFDDEIDVDYSGGHEVIDEVPYLKTDLSYQEASERYAQIFTGDALADFLARYFYDLDGVLYVTAVGGRSGYGMQDLTVSYTGQRDGDHLYEMTFILTYDPEQTVSCEVTVRSIGDEYRIAGMDDVF